jgi:hypothetical protein
MFYGERFLAHGQPPNWKTTSCQLSVAAYSMCLQLPSIAKGHFLHLQPDQVPYCGDKRPTYLNNLKLCKIMHCLSRCSSCLSYFFFGDIYFMCGILVTYVLVASVCGLQIFHWVGSIIYNAGRVLRW